MPPIISIIGNSKSGKTTLIEKLVPELKSRGYRVATLKHAAHSLTFDEPGKDSWRHIQAGSDEVVLSSSDKLVLIRPVAQEKSLDEIVPLFGEDYDIVLTEGFKHGEAPKIEVHRKENGPLLSDIKELIAIVTDEPLETKARQFSHQDIKGLAGLLEKGFLEPQRERISLYVNNIPITLTAFPKEVISKIILALASCLKGVGEVEKLEIFMKRKDVSD
jgi:molybdopterin-guanine dinucleotide biosynthesis protein B